MEIRHFSALGLARDHNARMGFYRACVRPLAFRLDPETVHDLAMSALARGWVAAATFADPRLEQTLLGVRFPNPVGLAAGFDKNGRALNHWHRLGFGFVEAGTVTFHPQPGNPKPRLFRVPEAQGLINRFGFNNVGAEAFAGTVRSATPRVPLGINLGKSKITDVERAAEDYAESFRRLHGHGDYFVINVSSPNTPGLRSLQDKEALRQIIQAMKAIDPARPVFVKVAPDLEFTALDEVVKVAVDENLAGIIATNTTIQRDMLPAKASHREETGGLSGLPVQARSDEVLAHLAKSIPTSMILIGVGGIFTADDAWRKITLGAHLVQLYTGFVYGGPSTVPTILRGLVERLEATGTRSLEEIRGSALR